MHDHMRDITLQTRNRNKNIAMWIVFKAAAANILNEFRAKIQRVILNLNSDMDHVSKWDATTVLKIDQKTDEPYVFIILNRPILFTPADFQRLWNHGMHYTNTFSTAD